MLLSELYGYKKHLGSTRAKLVAFLRDKGTEHHTGALGATLVGSKDYVYKIWSFDEAYEWWMDYCKRHSGPHVMKVLAGPKPLPFSLRSSVGEKQELKLKYAKIEKLEPLDHTTSQLFFHLNSVVERLLDHEVSDNLHKLAKHTLSGSKLATFEELEREQPEFLKFYFDTAVAADERGFAIDLHAGNVMKRGEKLVITDPAVGDSGEAPHYFFDEFEAILVRSKQAA